MLLMLLGAVIKKKDVQVLLEVLRQRFINMLFKKGIVLLGLHLVKILK